MSSIRVHHRCKKSSSCSCSCSKTPRRVPNRTPADSRPRLAAVTALSDHQQCKNASNRSRAGKPELHNRRSLAKQNAPDPLLLSVEIRVHPWQKIRGEKNIRGPPRRPVPQPPSATAFSRPAVFHLHSTDNPPKAVTILRQSRTLCPATRPDRPAGRYSTAAVTRICPPFRKSRLWRVQGGRE